MASAVMLIFSYKYPSSGCTYGLRCGYSHIFAVRWMHEIAVKGYLRAQNQEVIRRAF